MAKGTCSIDGCARPVVARGWCKRHYHRWAKYGDPLGGTPDGGWPTEHRFLAKVEKTDTCWLWIGARDPKGGYGHFKMDGRYVGAHRAAYMLFVGPIPDGLVLDHLCRVRHCVNPEHLEPVTHRENLLRGETLTAAEVKRTHCPQGHPYDEVNTYIGRTGGRFCRACRRSRPQRRQVVG